MGGFNVLRYGAHWTAQALRLSYKTLPIEINVSVLTETTLCLAVILLPLTTNITNITNIISSLVICDWWRKTRESKCQQKHVVWQSLALLAGLAIPRPVASRGARVERRDKEFVGLCKMRPHTTLDVIRRMICMNAVRDALICWV